MADFKRIASKWQKKWEEKGIFKSKHDSKKKKLKKYWFIFEDKDPEKLELLIDYLEREYGIEYVETRDFSPSFSFSIYNIIGINLGDFKQIVFNKKSAKIKWVCRECNFPVSENDLKVDKRVGKMACMNCGLGIQITKGVSIKVANKQFGNLQWEILKDNRTLNPYN